MSSASQLTQIQETTNREQQLSARYVHLLFWAYSPSCLDSFGHFNSLRPWRTPTSKRKVRVWSNIFFLISVSVFIAVFFFFFFGTSKCFGVLSISQVVCMHSFKSLEPSECESNVTACQTCGCVEIFISCKQLHPSLIMTRITEIFIHTEAINRAPDHADPI